MESCESRTRLLYSPLQSRIHTVSDISINPISSTAFASILTLYLLSLVSVILFHSGSQCVSHQPRQYCPCRATISPKTFSTPTTSSVPKMCSGRPRQPLFLALDARYQPLIDATRGYYTISQLNWLPVHNQRSTSVLPSVHIPSQPPTAASQELLLSQFTVTKVSRFTNTRHISRSGFSLPALKHQAETSVTRSRPLSSNIPSSAQFIRYDYLVPGYLRCPALYILSADHPYLKAHRLYVFCLPRSSKKYAPDARLSWANTKQPHHKRARY